MGLLRFLLALAVVIDHGRQPLFGIVLTGSTIAVQSFFMISGFYMALILNEKYVGPNTYRIFITNRFLRLFPLYWAVLLLTVAGSAAYMLATGNGLGVGLYIRYYAHMDPGSVLYLALTNIFLFGQDAVWFLKLTLQGALRLTTDFRNTAPQPFPEVIYFLLVPQSWTLGLELMFYLIAPFLVRRGLLKMLAVVIASLLLRAYVYSLGLGDNPAWVYRFFPTELAFFLSGAIAYRLYVKYRAAGLDRVFCQGAFYAIIGLTVLYQFIPAPDETFASIKKWSFYAAMVPAIGAIFLYTKDSKADRYLGELSYPMYLSHVFLWYITTYGLVGWDGMKTVYPVSVALTVAISALMVRFIVTPIERLRAGRLKKPVRL